MEAQLVVGASGVFEVAVNGAVVSTRGMLGFPSEPEIVEAVSVALT